MRTAIISDLHLGAASGEDVLRDAAVRRVLLAEVAAAERLVLLGDIVELRDLALGPALERARPFFEDLGAALGDRQVILVPGNHDHRLAEPLLDDLSLADAGPLGLEHRSAAAHGALAAIARWLHPARFEVAYPGVWLREDVYATHGHYMDAHLRLPRIECIAVAAMSRAAGAPPDPATPTDYERVTRPIYGFGFGLAQVRPAALSRWQRRLSEEALERVSRAESRPASLRHPAASAARLGFPAGIHALNRLLRSDFDPDVSAAAIFRGGLEAATEMARRLRIDDAHVITGHTHRGGPAEGEGEWHLPGGGRLHNTGSWCFATVFHHPGRPPNAYWPGTVTWVEEAGPPRRVQLLDDRSHAELTELVAQE